MDYSGWLWAIIDIAAVAVLAAVMFHAGYQYSHRNRAKDAATEATTRRNYVEEERRRHAS
ncbi:MAG: hypothetical protein JO208_11955 [Alphaproteobacteria bacterium]|nr:hypothetical protein [Alphaproteobacteria bacterium]